MTSRRRLRDSQRRRSRRIRAVLAAGMVFGVGAAVTLAAWNDSEYATTTVTAGTFSIASRTGSGAFTPHKTAQTAIELPLNATGLFPGQKRAALLQIQATGSLGGTLVLESAQVTNASGDPPTANNDIALRNALRIGVLPTVSASATPPACTDSTVTTQPLTSWIASLPSTSVELAAAGANTASYCIVVELPTGAANGAQGGHIRLLGHFLGSTG